MAQRLQIALVIWASATLGYNVVYIRRWRHDAPRPARYTQRVLAEIPHAYALPATIVATISRRAAPRIMVRLALRSQWSARTAYAVSHQARASGPLTRGRRLVGHALASWRSNSHAPAGTDAPHASARTIYSDRPTAATPCACSSAWPPARQSPRSAACVFPGMPGAAPPACSHIPHATHTAPAPEAPTCCRCHPCTVPPPGTYGLA
jgi:hypothetical protein